MVILAWLWCIFPYNLVQDIYIQSSDTDIFLKCKMAAAAILDFQFMWIWPFPRVDSMVLVLCTKFGSNICYSHWDWRTYASDLYLMTSRKLTSGFDFCSCDASCHIIWCKISLSSLELLTFFRNSRWRLPPSSIFRLCKFGHSSVLILWYLCSVSNLVQISVIVIEIDARML